MRSTNSRASLSVRSWFPAGSAAIDIDTVKRFAFAATCTDVSFWKARSPTPSTQSPEPPVATVLSSDATASSAVSYTIPRIVRRTSFALRLFASSDGARRVEGHALWVSAEEIWNDALEEGARSAGASLPFLNG